MKYSSLNDTLKVGVSHNSEIKKKVLITSGQIPHLTQLARTTFKPGQIADSHVHQDLYEIFNVESGQGQIMIDKQKYILSPGVCVTVEPGEEHEVTNIGESNLVLTIFGITT